MFLQVRLVSLLPDPEGHPADQQCDNEHHCEGDKVLRIAYGERKTGRHEEKIEGCDTQERCQHCRPFGRPACGKYNAHEIYHGDIYEFEISERKDGNAGTQAYSKNTPGPAAFAGYITPE